jgi:hypothetical protein
MHIQLMCRPLTTPTCEVTNSCSVVKKTANVNHFIVSKNHDLENNKFVHAWEALVHNLCTCEQVNTTCMNTYVSMLNWLDGFDNLFLKLHGIDLHRVLANKRSERVV